VSHNKDVLSEGNTDQCHVINKSWSLVHEHSCSVAHTFSNRTV